MGHYRSNINYYIHMNFWISNIKWQPLWLSRVIKIYTIYMLCVYTVYILRQASVWRVYMTENESVLFYNVALCHYSLCIMSFRLRSVIRQNRWAFFSLPAPNQQHPWFEAVCVVMHKIYCAWDWHLFNRHAGGCHVAPFDWSLHFLLQRWRPLP